MKPFLFATAALALAHSNCAYQGTSSKPDVTAFLSESKVDTTAKIPRLPFDHAWRDPAADFSQYTHIVVRPVTTRYLDMTEWTKSQSPLVPDQKAYQSDVTALAGYWNKSLKQQFSSPVCSYYITDNTSRPRTLVLQVAITRTTFGHPSDPAARTPTTRPKVAFEATLRDAATGRVLASASDLRDLPFQIQDFNEQSFTRANQQICDEWSRELMQATNKELFPKVRTS